MDGSVFAKTVWDASHHASSLLALTNTGNTVLYICAEQTVGD
jgi:hypothetical protein